MFGMTYILSVVLCLAVGVMLIYHLTLVAYGETSVEAQDNDVYLKQAKERNEVYSFPLQVNNLSQIYLFFPLRNLSIHMTAGQYSNSSSKTP
jgi:palmitoyltransferase